MDRFRKTPLEWRAMQFASGWDGPWEINFPTVTVVRQRTGGGIYINQIQIPAYNMYICVDRFAHIHV